MALTVTRGAAPMFTVTRAPSPTFTVQVGAFLPITTAVLTEGGGYLITEAGDLILF